MALKMDKELSSGITVSYFRISAVALDRSRDEAVITVETYLSEEARRAGKDPVEIKDVRRKCSEMTDLMAQLYSSVKSSPEYEQAQDA